MKTKRILTIGKLTGNGTRKPKQRRTIAMPKDKTKFNLHLIKRMAQAYKGGAELN